MAENLSGIIDSNQPSVQFAGERYPVVKYNADSASAVTYITDTSSFINNPSTINTIASSKLELQLNFLAK